MLVCRHTLELLLRSRPRLFRKVQDYEKLTGTPVDTSGNLDQKGCNSRWKGRDGQSCLSAAIRTKKNPWRATSIGGDRDDPELCSLQTGSLDALGYMARSTLGYPGVYLARYKIRST